MMEDINVPTAKHFTAELLANSYSNVKKGFVEAIEELKMRRKSEKHQEEKINGLITEMYELKRTKEEEVNALWKSLEETKQEKLKFQKELEEISTIQEEEKSTQNLSLSTSSKAVKTLKDEILALQLAKHALEKKIKEQDHQIQHEKLNRENFAHLVSGWKGIAERVEKQFLHASSRLDVLSDLVVKTEKSNEKLIQVNNHHKCVVKNCKDKANQLSKELATMSAEYAVLRNTLKDKENCNSCKMTKSQSCYLEARVKDLEEYHHQLGKELEDARKQKKQLLSSLSESSDLVSSVQSKYDIAVQCNGKHQEEIDLLKDNIISFKGKLKKGDDELARTKMELDEVDKSKQKLSSNLTGKVELLESNISTLQKSLDSLQAKYEEATQENESLLRRFILIEHSEEESFHQKTCHSTSISSSSEKVEKDVQLEKDVSFEKSDHLQLEEKPSTEIPTNMDFTNISSSHMPQHISSRHVDSEEKEPQQHTTEPGLSQQQSSLGFAVEMPPEKDTIKYQVGNQNGISNTNSFMVHRKSEKSEIESQITLSESFPFDSNERGDGNGVVSTEVVSLKRCSEPNSDGIAIPTKISALPKSSEANQLCNITNVSATPTNISSWNNQSMIQSVIESDNCDKSFVNNDSITKPITPPDFADSFLRNRVKFAEHVSVSFFDKVTQPSPSDEVKTSFLHEVTETSSN